MTAGHALPRSSLSPQHVQWGSAAFGIAALLLATLPSCARDPAVGRSTLGHHSVGRARAESLSRALRDEPRPIRDRSASRVVAVRCRPFLLSRAPRFLRRHTVLSCYPWIHRAIRN